MIGHWKRTTSKYKEDQIYSIKKLDFPFHVVFNHTSKVLNTITKERPELKGKEEQLQDELDQFMIDVSTSNDLSFRFTLC